MAAKTRKHRPKVGASYTLETEAAPPPPRLSPIRRRRLLHGWIVTDPGARASQAAALRSLRGEFRERKRELEFLEWSAGWLVREAWHRMRQAVCDCEWLDTRSEALGGQPHYVRSISAVFHSSEGLHALKCLSLRNFKSFLKKPPLAWRHAVAGDLLAAKGARILYAVREWLKDGFDSGEVVKWQAKEIGAMAHEGQATFFGNLGEILKDKVRRPERYQRPQNAWLLRMWIPLRLWECDWERARPDVDEDERRYRDAAILLNLPLPTERQFLTAWRNARLRVMKKEKAPAGLLPTRIE